MKTRMRFWKCLRIGDSWLISVIWQAVMIQNNDYNLSVNYYVETEDTREKIDINQPNAEIEAVVARENVPRAKTEKIIERIA